MAAEILESTPFEVYAATNFFNDDFAVLSYRVSPEKYVEYEELAKDPTFRLRFRQIAKAAETLTLPWYIRFIIVEVAPEAAPNPVARPVPEITSETVERALKEADRLLATGSASNAIDRAHTAFHGYLLAVAKHQGISVVDGEPLTSLFKRLRANHPRLGQLESDEHVRKIVLATATIIDTLNAARNNNSLAHPSGHLLAEPEAMLMINCTRTLHHYLDAKLTER